MIQMPFYVITHSFTALWQLRNTCRELKIVKSQANTAVLSLTAKSPNTHVSPNRGRSITVAFRRLLL